MIIEPVELPCPWCEHVEPVSEEDPAASQGEIVTHAAWYHNERDWRAVLKAVEMKLRAEGKL